MQHATNSWLLAGVLASPRWLFLSWHLMAWSLGVSSLAVFVLASDGLESWRLLAGCFSAYDLHLMAWSSCVSSLAVFVFLSSGVSPLAVSFDLESLRLSLAVFFLLQRARDDTESWHRIFSLSFYIDDFISSLWKI